MPIVLKICSGDEVKHLTLTTTPQIIGRSGKCDLQLEDSMISGRHLEVKLLPSGKAHVKDLETTNGTFINQYKITEAQVYLEDEITIGKIVISLDKDKMETREKLLHKREGEKTSAKFLEVDEKTLTKVQEEKTADSIVRNDQFSDVTQFVNHEDKKAQEEQEKIGSAKEALRNRLVSKSRDVDQKHKKELEKLIKGRKIDLEEDSGKNSSIKIDKVVKKFSRLSEIEITKRDKSIFEKIRKFLKRFK